MNYPAIERFIESVGDPHGRLRTMQPFEVVRDAYGCPLMRVGRNAVVFCVERDGKREMLKCYTRPAPHAGEIYDYLSAHPSRLIVPAQLLCSEIFVYDLQGEGRWYDVVRGEWAEGLTLAGHVRMASQRGDCEALETLAAQFCRLASGMLSAGWAHGDLKPENVMVSPGGGMRLVDCEAMFIPPLEGRKAVEAGTPAFQHPARAEAFDRHIDDFPIALIALGLRALALDPSLWRFCSGGDGMLLDPCDAVNGQGEVWEVLARMAPLRKLMALIKNPSYRLEGLETMIKDVC